MSQRKGLTASAARDHLPEFQALGDNPVRERQAKRLEKFYDRITSCHVTIVAPTMRRRKGELFAINIRVAIPQHKDILVSKTHGDAPEHEHVMVAIKDAFAAAQRQIRNLDQ